MALSEPFPVFDDSGKESGKTGAFYLNLFLVLLILKW